MHPRSNPARLAPAAAARLAPLALVALLAAACAGPRPSQLPPDEPYVVEVKSARLPPWSPWWTLFAHHTWVDVKRGSESEWWRAEVVGRGAGVVYSRIDPADARSDSWLERRQVHLLATITGDEARRIGEQIEPACERLDARFAEGYLKWPGPNSNTFVAQLAREIPELAFVFDPNAIGKDWTWFHAGLAPSKTGVALDLPLVGATLAAREGVELHALGLTLGVSLWPPSLELPFLPRIPQGFAIERANAIPPPPQRDALRIDLTRGATEPVAHGFELPIEDGVAVADLALVDVESGEWLMIHAKIRPPPAGQTRGSYELDGVVHSELADSDDSRLGPIDPSGIAEVPWRFGSRNVAATLRITLAGAIARVEVALARPAAP